MDKLPAGTPSPADESKRPEGDRASLDLVEGGTTAATIWCVTVMGLRFGGGQLALGTAAPAVAATVV